MSPFPKPQVAYVGYSDLYFATEGQIHSPFALGNFDRGELTIMTDGLKFRGMTVEVDCKHISSVGLVRKTFPWGILCAVTAAALLLVYLNAPTPFSWQHPPIYLVAIILVVVSAIQWREEWVEVIYADTEHTQRAYFRRQPIFWGFASGRTRKLCEEIRDKVLAVQ